MDKSNLVKVHSFDGQSVNIDRNTVLYEVGHYLGGGAAGNVYECEHVQTKERFALKILNPLGYKLLSTPLLRRCTILTKGRIATEAVEKQKELIGKEHVWWVVNGSTKQYIAAHFSERQGTLKEFSLTQCIQIWGVNPTAVGDDESGEGDATTEVLQTVNGPRIRVPVVPPKYADFVRRRRRIFREIENMLKISNHVNVIKLESVLELTQESKCTIFLVMELANGGELFDRIKIDCGTREDTAKFFFQQLLLGVKHCHEQGVCHRDLKPENLLLQDGVDNVTILKIADFGFSARFAMEMNAAHNVNGPTQRCPTSTNSFKQVSQHSSQVAQMMYMAASPSASDELQRVLKSVVGSPFYVAPEVLQARGYDGPKADIWSLGVILYAMLAGNLPFEQELSTCKRFRLFGKWVREQTEKGVIFHEDSGIEFPSWLFPAKFSDDAKGLIVAMLHPDPEKRITIPKAMKHRLLVAEGSAASAHSAAETDTAAVALESTSIAINEITAGVAGMARNASTGSLSNLSQNLSALSEEEKHYKISRSGPNQFSACNTSEQKDGISKRKPQINVGDCTMDEDKAIFKDAQGAIISHPPPRLAKNEDDTFRDINKDLFTKTNQSRKVVSDDERKINTGKCENTQGADNTADDSDFHFEMEEDDETESIDPLSSTPTQSSTVYQVHSNVASRINSEQEAAPPRSGIACEVPGNTYFVESPSDDMIAYRSAEVTSVYEISGSPIARSYEAHQRLPPPAPLMGPSPSLDDLLVNEDDEIPEIPCMNRDVSVSSSISANNTNLPPSFNTNLPPSFNDTVKRSTRFITTVPAAEVLSKVECVLEHFRALRTQTPIGLIGKIALHWETFRLEVWGNDNITGPPLCALQLYQMPVSMIAAATPARLSQGGSRAVSSEATGAVAVGYFADIPESRAGRSPGIFLGMERRMTGGFYNIPGDRGSFSEALPQELFLVEFVRGQLEIFAFKRFYDWVRHRLSELVKRDYSSKIFEHSSSPMVPSSLLQKFQEDQARHDGHYESASYR